MWSRVMTLFGHWFPRERQVAQGKLPPWGQTGVSVQALHFSLRHDINGDKLETAEAAPIALARRQMANLRPAQNADMAR